MIMVFGIETTYEHISKKKWKQHKANNFNMILRYYLNFMNFIRKETKSFNVTTKFINQFHKLIPMDENAWAYCCKSSKQFQKFSGPLVKKNNEPILSNDVM